MGQGLDLSAGENFNRQKFGEGIYPSQGGLNKVPGWGDW